MEKIKTKFNVEVYAESRIGGRNENQDSYGYADTPCGFLMVVCDGMGGLNGGKTASTIAVNAIIDSVMHPDEDGSISVVLSKALTEANKAVIEASTKIPGVKGMGTTATALLVNNDVACVAHVGDSRIYQLRGTKKVFRTFDHSMVFNMVRNKIITEEQARLSAQSNIITRALGINNEVIVDTKELEYKKGDRFVLCSDGFHSAMTERAFMNEIGAKGHLNLILDNLAEKIDNIGKSKGGGHDNLTAAVVAMKNSSKGFKKKRVVKSIICLSIVAIIVVLGSIFYPRNVDNKYKGEKTIDTLVKDTVVDATNNEIIENNNKN